MANTASSLTHIESNWLIRQQPGMDSQSHTRIYYMLVAHNGVSVLFAIALATPYFFGPSGTAKKKVLRTFCLMWQRLRSSAQREDNRRDYTSVTITSASLVLSTSGSLLLALLAPFPTAISLWEEHHKHPNLWVLVQQWSTPPRATCLMFPIMAILGGCLR